MTKSTLDNEKLKVARAMLASEFRYSKDWKQLAECLCGNNREIITKIEAKDAPIWENTKDVEKEEKKPIKRVNRMALLNGVINLLTVFEEEVFTGVEELYLVRSNYDDSSNGFSYGPIETSSSKSLVHIYRILNAKNEEAWYYGSYFGNTWHSHSSGEHGYEKNASSSSYNNDVYLDRDDVYLELLELEKQYPYISMFDADLIAQAIKNDIGLTKEDIEKQIKEWNVSKQRIKDDTSLRHSTPSFMEEIIREENLESFREQVRRDNIKFMMPRGSDNNPRLRGTSK